MDTDFIISRMDFAVVEITGNLKLTDFALVEPTGNVLIYFI